MTPIIIIKLLLAEWEKDISIIAPLAMRESWLNLQSVGRYMEKIAGAWQLQIERHKTEMRAAANFAPIYIMRADRVWSSNSGAARIQEM